MKKNIKIVSFLMLITILVSFSNAPKSCFVRKAFLSDSIKKNDTISALDAIKIADSIANLSIKLYKKNVEASHYSDKLNGRRTASGQIFSNKKYTAAHKKPKFGTQVKVTNLANNKSVIVTINDRGPHTKNREIDLAKRPFLDISHNNGRTPMRVSLEIIE